MTKFGIPEFYMVMSEKPDRSAPRVQHSGVEIAKAEAKRLASANPGEAFFVLRCIGMMKMQNPVQWTDADEIPF